MLNLLSACTRFLETRRLHVSRTLLCVATGPNASRGYDVAEYQGLWHALTRDHTWPSEHSIAVVGLATGDFTAAIEAKCTAAAGCEVLSLNTRF